VYLTAFLCNKSLKKEKEKNFIYTSDCSARANSVDVEGKVKLKPNILYGSE